ncbi:MAG: uroporphyrinogen-III C-methyltransferase [Nitrospiraceae bacterium]
MAEQPGKVYLVGAGPGDPKLLTLRGKECLEQAEVVLYDYLANPVLLDLAPKTAERIYVGRRGRGRYPDQGEINQLLIQKAREGKTVVRLKGGDPFVFGRGGEEAEAVATAGLPFEIVPGVTSAVAVPAYAGIPVTHRTFASTVAFATGHEDSTKEEGVLEWPRLASAEGTLVFLMGMKKLPSIVAHLLSEGKSAETPVALIRWGTRSGQRTVIGTLANIVQKAEEEELAPPTVIVVGEVVRLREQLNWFETRPLFGRRILVTRARAQAGELSRLLADQGGEPLECPTIEIVPPQSWKELDRAIGELAQYQWLIFTSMNGVRPFFERLREHGLDARAASGVRICCIGPRTAQELAHYGLQADLVPTEYQAEGLIDALKVYGLKGQRLLIPRAAVARELLPDQLQALGAQVDVVTAYRTVLPSVDVKHLREQFERREIHVITFTSSSTVRNFCELFNGKQELQGLTSHSVIACIGPITAQTAVEVGLPVTITAVENTIPALAEAIIDYFSKSQDGAQLRC